VGELGLPELLLILAIAVLIFGPRKLGELGKGLGEGIRSFKSAVSGEKEAPKETPGESKQA
jgi:sec-independent protein translocase protein TatA